VALTVLDELHRFLDEHLPGGWSEAKRSGDSEQVAVLAETLDNPAFVRLLGRAGWVAPQLDPAHGGRGLGEHEARAAMEELDRWQVPHVPRGSGLPLAAPTIIQWASEPTKRRLLPPLVSGEERWCQLFSEPGAGSDLASLASSAVRDGDEWVVNGQKVWTTYGHESELGMLLARTDPGVAKHQGITYFAVDMRAPGVEVRPLVQMTGEHEFNEVFLTEVRIPDLLRISPIGDGWGAAQTTLQAERFALSGVRRKRRARDEILGGKTIDDVLALATQAQAQAPGMDDGVRRDRTVQEVIRSRVLALTSQRFRTPGSGRPVGPIGSITKITKASANQSLQVLAVELRGAAGQAWEAGDTASPGFVRELLRTRANSIEGGTSEIQRNIVGERVLGRPREPDPWKGVAWDEVPRS
jgi:alkylation response protein AidB-like acyl-CoA dehydrogenase